MCKPKEFIYKKKHDNMNDNFLENFKKPLQKNI